MDYHIIEIKTIKTEDGNPLTFPTQDKAFDWCSRNQEWLNTLQGKIRIVPAVEG